MSTDAHPVKSSQRITSLEFVRVCAMVAVIVIHVTSVSIGLGRAAYYLNQMARFAVPAFVLLSGISLSLSNRENANQSILKIVPLYLFWCIFYQSVLTPHLYFIVIIVQMYLLYPYLKLLKTRFPKALLISALAVGIAVTTITYLADFGMDFRPDVSKPFLWYLFPTWLGYFVLGMYITRENVGRLCAFFRRHMLLLGLCTAVCAVLYIIEAKAGGTPGSSIKPSLFVYSPLVCAFLCGLGEVLSPRLGGVFIFMSKYSLTVYFAHVRILTHLRRLAFFQNPDALHIAATICIATVLSLAFAFAFDNILEIIKKWITGKMPPANPPSSGHGQPDTAGISAALPSCTMTRITVE